MTDEQEVKDGDERNQGCPSAGRPLHNEGRQVDVQGSEQRTPERKRRRKDSAGELSGDGARSGSLDGAASSPGVRPGHPAGAGVRQQHEPGQRDGLDTDEYPLNLTIGPTVEVDGTNIVTKP